MTCGRYYCTTKSNRTITTACWRWVGFATKSKGRRVPLALMQAALDAANSDHAPDPRLIARAQALRDEFLARRFTHPPITRVADVNDTAVRAGVSDSGARIPVAHDGESYL